MSPWQSRQCAAVYQNSSFGLNLLGCVWVGFPLTIQQVVCGVLFHCGIPSAEHVWCFVSFWLSFSWTACPTVTGDGAERMTSSMCAWRKPSCRYCDHLWFQYSNMVWIFFWPLLPLTDINLLGPCAFLALNVDLFWWACLTCFWQVTC